MTHKYYLTAMAMFKNDAIYLKEWLDFHLLIGFQHFYMYDNMSEDNPIEILQPYIDLGVVTYTPWNRDLANYPACNPHRMHHIEKYGELSRWIGFFDIDEFIYPTMKNESLCDILTEFETFPGVQVHFMVFGSNGYEKYEPGLVINRFTKRANPNKVPDSVLVKSIVDPRLVEASPTAHIFKYKNNTVAVNCDKILYKSDEYKYSHSRIILNHYVTKSREEYLQFKPKCKIDHNRIFESRFNKSFSMLNEITDTVVKDRYAKDIDGN